MIYPEAKGNFSQHLMLIKGSKQVGKVLVMIWIAVIRTIWWVRNNVVFKAGSAEVEKMVDAIQLKVWIWLKVGMRDFTYSFYEWVNGNVSNRSEGRERVEILFCWVV